ncbi:hypothetical protein MNB_SV-4-434 [hydrothermal vent metagenome]|uniref:L,D-TPase catalytic domain-containing protein n=1 Tax=hydrothermal vent metagenome TaxID=652676 RepID=A0A1W1EAE0_9ZZZZ
MKIKAVLIAAFAIVLSGCVGTPDSEGWHSSQKEAFLQILEDDAYMSICNNRALYEKVRSSEDSRLMSRLLIDYANNLANGCIDITSFKKAQEARKSDKFKTHYTFYKQRVDANAIRMQLKAGQNIKKILRPYVPPYREFDRLVNAYHTLKKESNTSSALLQKIRLNIERVKLMKPIESKNYALVNIPEYTVRIIENGKTAVKMKVVVGKRDKQTPIFSQNLQYVVLNPQWNVPDSIARNEIIPKALKDPNYLKKHRMVIRRDYNLKSPALHFSELDAEAYVEGEGKVPFKFIEVPSKKNGLGRVKFLFPNRHSVYMHDTQSKYLFKRTVRCYSHGCVRLEKPKTMLRYIIKHYSATPFMQAQEMYDSLKTHFIKIVKPLPVHTAYLTVYVEDDGSIHTFKDVYGYDRLQKLNFRE